jgi:hypothetical protein
MIASISGRRTLEPKFRLDREELFIVEYFLETSVTVWDLVFLASVVLELSFLIVLAVHAARRQWSSMRRTAGFAVVYLAVYAVVLVAAALLMPRRYLAPGERRCFDDWCVTATTCRLMRSAGGTSTWVATVEVSSVAKRVRQRARDAEADLEDTRGRRYPPCAAPLTEGSGPARELTDALSPGESFQVLLPFRLPGDAQPAGLVIHHGAFPGAIIIAEDQAFLHPPALARLEVGSDR